VENEHDVREEAVQHASMLPERAHICGSQLTPADSVRVRSDSRPAPLYSSYMLSRGTRSPVAVDPSWPASKRTGEKAVFGDG